MLHFVTCMEKIHAHVSSLCTLNNLWSSLKQGSLAAVIVYEYMYALWLSLTTLALLIFTYSKVLFSRIWILELS